MLKISAFLVSAIALNACAGDETVSGFVDADAVYHLVELDGAPFDHRATISFPAEGEVSGQAPCNRYFATQSLPYPWFNVEMIGATRMACPELELETIFFRALEAATLAEVSGSVLILSNETGGELVFEAR